MTTLNVPFPRLEVQNPGKQFDQLFSELHAATTAEKKRGRVRRNQYTLWNNPEVTLYGWKFNEWDYGKSSIVLPTNARGMFSIMDDNDGTERIAVRGYDKFFNINEVPETRWDWIEANTQGPYEVTSKENGCIVFISGLKNGTLIVTSKQATGPGNSPREKNHSWVAQQWVERHLATKNIPVKEFAELLYDMQVTAVGELCDDDFEEHVLAYPGDKAGIYLHGLNLNIANFTTYPFSSIEQFASQFGFHTTPYVIKETLPELRSFLEGCAETGSWNGVEVEGFVIRSKAQKSPTTPPFDFFFKYKFEEPYLMYRQWREISRAYLSGKSRDQIRINKHQAISNRYLDFVIPLFNTDPDLRVAYNESHGIISLREKFLKTLGKSGSDILQEEEEESNVSSQEPHPNKYVLIPVSTVGCGKTTVAVALSQLFPKWGHFQNDDITSGPKPQKLVQYCVDYLKVEDVVFVDRNNHQFRERAQLFADFPKLTKFVSPNYIYICLNFNPFSSQDNKTWNLTSSRVLKRGDNHQSIYASSDASSKVMGILSGFKSRYQPVVTSKSPDDQFDFVIDLDSTKENSSRVNLEIIVTKLHEQYPELVPTKFSKSELDAAYQYALEYKPKKSGPSKAYQDKEKEKAAKPKKPSYFGVAIDFAPQPASEISQQSQLISLIDRFFKSNPQLKCPVWPKLKQANRVQQAFHVTLVHVKQSSLKSPTQPAAKELYDKYHELYKSTLTASSKVEEGSSDGFTTVKSASSAKKAKSHPVALNVTVDVKLKSLAWNNELLVLEAELLESSTNTTTSPSVVCLNRVPHITIGTINSSIPAVRAGEALAAAAAPSSSDDGTSKNELTKVDWNIEPFVFRNQQITAYP